MKRMMAMLMLTSFVLSTWAEVFRDDFNDENLEGWVVLRAREASIENGELVLDFPPPDPANIRVGFLGAVSKDYEVTVSVKIIELMFPPIIANGVKIGLRAHAIDDELMFPPNIANGVKIDLRAHAIDEILKIPLLQYHLSYNFFLGRHTDGRTGIGASIWYVHKIVKRPKIDRVQFMNNVKLPERDKVEIWNKVEIRNKLLEFSPFAFEMDKWYRLKVIARDNRFQVFVDQEKMLDFLDNTYTEGRVYLSSGLGNRVHFDDFEVRWGGALAVQPQRKLTTTWGQIKRSFR